MLKISEWVPLSTLAIKPHACEVDDELISKRFMRVTLLILASSIACAVYLSKVASFSYRRVINITILDLTIPLCFTLIAWVIDKKRANALADKLAVNIYQTYVITTSEATERIYANPDLLSKLTETEIYKTNNKGQTILDELLEYIESSPVNDIPEKECLIEKVPKNSKEFFAKLIKSKK